MASDIQQKLLVFFLIVSLVHQPVLSRNVHRTEGVWGQCSQTCGEGEMMRINGYCETDENNQVCDFRGPENQRPQRAACLLKLCPEDVACAKPEQEIPFGSWEADVCRADVPGSQVVPYGTSCRLVCAAGYKITSHDTITCGYAEDPTSATGQYDQEMPACANK